MVMGCTDKYAGLTTKQNAGYTNFCCTCNMPLGWTFVQQSAG